MRTVPALVFALLLAGTALPGALRAQTAGTPAAGTATAAPDPLAALPADLRDKFNHALEKAAAAQRDDFDQKMKAATVALVKAAALASDAPLKDLAAASRVAKDRSREEWEQAIRQRMADNDRQAPELTAVCIETLANPGDGADHHKAQSDARALASIEALADMTGAVAAPDNGPLRYTPPEEQPAWTEAVRRVLTPEQLAAWQVSRAQEKNDDQEITKYVETQVDHTRESFVATMKNRLDELQTALELPPDRIGKIDALGRLTVEQALKVYRAYVTRSVHSMNAENRRRILAAGRINFGPQGNDTPSRQEVWKVGLDTLLTAADRQRLGAVQGERDARRARALGRMLLVILDEKTALTAPQRDRLLEPAEEAVKQVKALFPPSDSQNYYQFSREQFFEAAAHVPEETARAILDPAQWQHWQQACKDSAEGRDTLPGRRGGRRPPDAAEKKEPPLAENAEPEEIERFLSDAFDEKAAEERQRELAVLLLKTEDAARVADLEEPTTARLRTAARGTVEESLVAWKANLAQNVRSQIENGDLENIRNLLANIPNMQFGVNESMPGAPENRSIWDKTVDRELTAPQLALWQGEVAARTAYKEQATAALVLAEFDRRYQLSGSQCEKLQPPLQAVMRDYSLDIRRMFGYSPGNTPWFFQSYTMFLPLMGIPGDELKAILGKDRWEHWNTSAEHNNGVNYWQNIQQYHDAKLKGNNE